MIYFFNTIPERRPGIAITSHLEWNPVGIVELMIGSKTLEDIWGCQLIQVTSHDEYEKLKLYFPELPIVDRTVDGREFEEDNRYPCYYIPNPWASLIAMNFPLNRFKEN